MGSSECGGAGLADTGAGSIVWVRRRNGSWWPGKILGPDELSATHLMSPRSGTPVKLLGREDASVDWYNLEKSKRVKAFRCGEFDDCIGRAEASLGLPAKKREKYARREDAILHALELEKQYLEKKYGKLATVGSVREKSADTERKDLVKPSRPLENGNGKLGNHELYQLDQKVGVSSMMDRNALHAHKAKDVIHPTLEEKNLEAGHRVRALQDFGLRTVPVNRIYTSAASDDSNKMPADIQAFSNAANDPSFDNCGDSDSRNESRKGKRTFEGFVQEPLPKRRVRYPAESTGCSLQPDEDHVSLYGNKTGDGAYHSIYFPDESTEIFNRSHDLHVQMEMPVSQLDADHVHSQHDNSAEESSSGSSEETESDSSERRSLKPHLDVGTMLSDAETSARAQSRMLDRSQREGAGDESTSGDDSDELSLDERSQFYIDDPNASGIEVSKWQLKGKRNVRSYGRRPIDRFARRMYLEGKGGSLSQRTSNSLSYYHETDYNNDVDLIDDDFDPHTQGMMNQRGCLPSQVAAKRPNLVGQNMIDWEELTWGRPFRGYWEERCGSYNSMFVGRNGHHDMLIDVDLKVQANRQGEHVPWVSLMSRLNGKAIIGHPIQIEALEDGSTDMLVSTSDVHNDDPMYEIEKNTVPPVWRTARRTANFRVPRPHLSTTQLDDCDEDADIQYFHQSGKVRSKKSSSLRKGGSVKKSKSHTQGMKKPARRVKANSSGNQKTKPLSSIGFDHHKSGGNRRGGGDSSSNYYMDGVIKPVGSGPPAVACIPVKLVFSRLLEAVGRPPSGHGKHRGSSEQQQQQLKGRNPS